MSMSIPFGARSTADQVLAGVDLSGRHFLITGCSAGIGRATLDALAANGAHVIGLARTLPAAARACAEAGPGCVPIECDLSDLQSVAAAARAVRELGFPLDAVITSAGVVGAAGLKCRYGVELQFLVNYLGHFALVNQVLDLVRNVSGRIVLVSSHASIKRAPREGIMFDNLDGAKGYDPVSFYAQSKLAVALYAAELARRLRGRGVAVNALHPGITRESSARESGPGLRFIEWAIRPFRKSTAQAAATQALLAASPQVAGVSGEYWSNCQIATGNPLLRDGDLAARLWDVSQQIVARHLPEQPPSWQAAA